MGGVGGGGGGVGREQRRRGSLFKPVYFKLSKSASSVD